MNKLEQAARELLEVADGIQHGTDWNNGTHAKIYRPKFPEAITALREALAEPQITTPDVCGEVCARAKLCYGCNKDLEEANAKFAEQAEQEPVKVTGAMVYAFHHALTDAAIGAGEFDEIKLGLEAAFVNITDHAEPVNQEPVAMTTTRFSDNFIAWSKAIPMPGTKLYAAPVQQAEQDPVIRATLAPPAPPEVYQMRSKDAYEAGWWEAQRQKAVSPIAPVQQAEQEPAAIVDEIGLCLDGRPIFNGVGKVEVGQPLYATPVRTKDLTDDEIDKAFWDAGGTDLDGCRAVIAADREKNK